MLVKLYGELQERENKQRKELLVRRTELETQMRDIREQIKNGGDLVSLRQRFSELDNELSEVKNEINALGEIYSARDLTDACGSVETIWEELFPAERYKLAHQLIDKITLYVDHIIMDVKHHGLKSLIGELKTDENIEVYQPENSEIIPLNIPVMVKRWNGRKLIVTPGKNESEQELPEHEPTAMAKRLAQAHKWTKMLESGKHATVTQLADAVNYDPSKTLKILNLVNLSPAIQKMITEGNAPESLTLRKLYGNVPLDWEEQQKMFLPQPM